VIGLAPGVIDPRGSPGLVPPPADIALSPGVMLLDTDNVGVVPDGVTRVKWVFDGWGQTPPGPRAVYPRIHGNVAISKTIPGEYHCAAPPGTAQAAM